MRVAMIIQGYLPRIGGAERQLAALAPLLRQQGLEIDVITRRYPGMSGYDLMDGVNVYRLPVPGPKPIASLAFTLSAQSLLRRLRPDVIHAHELLSPTTTAVTAKRWLGVPVAAKVLRGGRLGDLAKLKGKPLGLRRIQTFRQEVDAFITISQEIDQELAQVNVPEQRRFFIPNGVDTERFVPVFAKTKIALRAALGLPDGRLTIFIGRLVAEKRLDHLLAIWPAVRATHPDANLLLLGTGPEDPRLRQQAGAGVQFAGHVEDVAPYLQAADLFVLPSTTEGLSNAMLEAMAAGLPVIATAVGGAPDVIEHRQNGWLIPPDEPVALQDAVLALLNSPGLRAQLGYCGRKQVQRHYALPVTAQRLRALYERLVTGSSNG